MTTQATTEKAVRAGAGTPKGSRPGSGPWWAKSLPLLPAIILMLIFMAGPIIYAFYGSFTNRSMTGPNAADPKFVGLDNYVSMFHSTSFWQSLGLTLLFVIASAIIGQNVLGMALAVMMREAPKALSSTISAIVVGAWVLPEIVASYACYAFFTSEGTLNSILGWFGVSGPAWLVAFPMFAVILANVWRGTAFSMMVFSAALAEVPPEITESAQIDGANAWQRFIRITVPMIRSSISTNLMLTTLQTLGVFTLIFVMTGGGPGTASSTLPVLAYQEAFKFSQVGYGTAIAVVTLIIGGIFAAVYIKLLKPEVD